MKKLFPLMIVLSIFAKETLAQQFPSAPEGVTFILSHVDEPSTDNGWTYRAWGTLSEDEPGLIDWNASNSTISILIDGNEYWGSGGQHFTGDTLNLAWTVYGVQPGVPTVVTAYFNQYVDGGWIGDPIEWQEIASIPFSPEGIATGIRNAQTTKLSVYPNPTSNDVVVTGFKDVDEQIFLFDLLGNVVLRVQTNKLEKVSIGLSELPAGMYILQTSKGSLKITKTGI
jgi:hypothetical protein